MTTRTASTYARRSPPARRPPTDRHFTTVSISGLREAIHSLDTKMASLMKQRKELETHLEQAVRSQSPVLRLPSELLSSIFVVGVFQSDDQNPIMVSTLMLVCRYWAEVALDSPVLWSKIAVGQHDSLQRARRSLSRSKSWPLDVSVNFGPHMDYTSNVMEQVIHAMDLIRPALWRTRSFNLCVSNRPQAHAALLRCQEEAPILETLAIQIHHSMPEDHYSNPPLPLFNGHTPRLRSCSFTSFNFGWDPRLVSRLTVLKLGGYFNGFTPSFNTLLSILRQCPDLRELALRNISNADYDPCAVSVTQDRTTMKLIQLPKLVKISFYYVGIALARHVMGHIAFPNLVSMEMCCMENVTPILQLLHTQSLTRLPLRRLRIESALFNELKFLNLLSRLTSLITLELVDVEDASSSLLKGLSTSEPWICPRLQTLTLDGCTALDWDSLRTCVESRLPANSGVYPRHQDVVAIRGGNVTTSSASAAAARGHRVVPSSRSTNAFSPQRFRQVDVTRCSQISKEMVQWLRMYVADVKCEPAKSVWGQPTLP